MNRGCLLEQTWKGTEPLILPTGEKRTFLEDGDEVTIRGYCRARSVRPDRTRYVHGSGHASTPVKRSPPVPTKTAASTTFIESLGVRDVALMVIIAVIAMRWIPRGARAGAPSVVLWAFAGLLFFVPLALGVVDLSRRFPEQGGLYMWVRHAFGPRHAFCCGWCLWLTNVFYFPNYLLFAQSNFLALGGEHWSYLNESRAFTIAFVLLCLWGLTAINILGFDIAKWVQNIGTLGIWIPAALLFVAGALAFAHGRSATSFRFPNLIPRGGSLSNLALWSSMCFAFSGVEIAGLVSQEIRSPKRSITLGIVIASFVITAIYIGGSAAILSVIPSDRIAERTAIGDAVALATHSQVTYNLVFLLLGIASLATTSSWIACSARVPYAAAVDERMPKPLSRLHPRYRTPYVALNVQAAIASLVLLISLFLKLGPSVGSVADSYDVMVNLTILTYFIPYLYLFVIPLKLKAYKGSGRSFLEPKSQWPVSLAGLATTLLALGLLFVPPPGTRSALTFEISVLSQSALVLIAGLVVYRASRPPA